MPDTLLDEIREISDDGSGDYIDTPNGPEVNHEHIERSRLRIQARQWMFATIMQMKYGDRVTTTSTTSSPAASSVAAAAAGRFGSA